MTFILIAKYGLVMNHNKKTRFSWKMILACLFSICILGMSSNGNHTKQRKWILSYYCNVMITIFFMITNNNFLDCFTSNSYNPCWFHTKFLAWAHFKKPIDGPYVGIMYLSHFLPSFQIALKVYVKVQWVKPWASRGVTSEHIEDLKYHP